MSTVVTTPDPATRTIKSHELRPNIPVIYNPDTGGYSTARDAGDGLAATANYVWNTGTLAWEKAVQAGGGGGGGGAVTVADGADVALGTTADAAVITDSVGTVSGKLRGLVTILASVWDSINGRLKVDGSAVTQPVSGTFWQATQPVSLASVPSHAVTNVGTFAVQVTSAPTTAVTGPVTDAQLRATPVPVSQPAATDWRTDLRRGTTQLFAVINASGVGDNTLVAADATKKIKVLQYTLVSAGIVNITFKSGAGTAISGAIPLVANSGAVSPFVPPAAGHLLETAVNQALVLNLSAGIAITGHLTYILEA